jgi:hypothetical protein
VVARRLYELGQAQASGALSVTAAASAVSPSTVTVELLRGWVHAIDLASIAAQVGPQPIRGEDALRLLLPLAVDARFVEGTPPRKRGACTPFHPAAVVRNFVDRRGRELEGWPEAWRARVGAGTVELVQPPHPSCIGHDERPLVAFLGRPRAADEIDAAQLCPPARAERLLAFLYAVGALKFVAATASPYKLLELPEGAPAEDVKRAYRRLARELHPDRHPTAAPEDLRDLERRFAEVSAAYRRLV